MKLDRSTMRFEQKSFKLCISLKLFEKKEACVLIELALNQTKQLQIPLLFTTEESLVFGNNQIDHNRKKKQEKWEIFLIEEKKGYDVILRRNWQTESDERCFETFLWILGREKGLLKAPFVVLFFGEYLK